MVYIARMSAGEKRIGITKTQLLILLSLPVYERIYVFPAYSRFNVADNYDYFFIFADRKCRGVFRPVTKSSMQQSNYIIEVKNVSKFFGDKIALDNINLYVKKENS